MERREYGRAPRAPKELQEIIDFLAAQHHAGKAAGEKWPVPLLGQWLDRPSHRRTFGGVFVRMMITFAEKDSGEPPQDTALVSHRVFNDLDTIREGAEGAIPQETRRHIRANTHDLDTPRLRIGRRILATLHGHPAYGTADDALLAIELDALPQVAVAEADELAA